MLFSGRAVADLALAADPERVLNGKLRLTHVEADLGNSTRRDGSPTWWDTQKTGRLYH